MDENRRSPRAIATGAAALLVAVVVLNVVPRLVSLPSIDVPSLGLPDLPDWAHELNRIKNWVLIGIAILAVAGFVAEELEKDRRRKKDAEQ